MLAVVIQAAGMTGTETMQLRIDEQVVAEWTNVGGNVNTREFETFTYTPTQTVNLNQLRVAFTNDGLTPGGADRNLFVDAVILDGARFETEAPTVFSTATWDPVNGTAPGFKSQEFISGNGYFVYAPPTAGYTVEVFAAGQTGTESMQLLIDNAPVATFVNVAGNYTTGAFLPFRYTSPTLVSADRIRVAFTNDGDTPGGQDRNLRVDRIAIDGVTHQSEAPNVFTTGLLVPAIGQVEGFWHSEFLNFNGYLEYASDAQAGTVNLQTSLIFVNESAGTVSIPVVRNGGSDGTVGIEYTTVNASAVAGQDYVAQSGLIVFQPGQTIANIVVALIDTGDLGDEAFNIAADLPLGGAIIGLPRTATVTIVDDDIVREPGTGNGLRAQYYDNPDLTDFLFQRTDITVDFNWGAGSPAASVGPDTFSVSWTGQIQPLFSETYTFRTTTNDGVRLTVNNQLIIDGWSDTGTNVRTGTIALLAGVHYEIRLDYREDTGDASARLEWSSTSQALQIVPQSQLYSQLPPPGESGAFSAQRLTDGLIRPTSMDFDSSGRIFIAEQGGVVRVFRDGQLQQTPFIDMSAQVNFVQDRGLVGIAVHPNFPTIPFIYLAYTYDPPETLQNTGLAGPDGQGNRVARMSHFTATIDPVTGDITAVPGSEVVILGTNSTWDNIGDPSRDSTSELGVDPSCPPDGTLEDCICADSQSHTLGNLMFAPDGTLWVASGDGASYGRVDPRAPRVQDIHSLSGKLLRIDPITGEGLPDNPFFGDDGNTDPHANQAKVVNYGLRNPFRFALHPVTGVPYQGDVGWGTWEEINYGMGQNFGWPWYEGEAPTNGYNILPEAAAFYADNNAVAPMWSRSHADGAVAIVVGDFYTGNLYPSSFHHALFFSDFGDMQLRVMRLNGDGSLSSVTPLGLSAGLVVEMSMGEDGYIYYVDLLGNLGRLVFTPDDGNAPVLDFGDGFAGAESQLDLNGTAAIAGTAMRLTSGEQVQTASVFSLEPVDVTSFSTQFEMQLTPGTLPMADGLTFTIQTVGSSAIGDGGGSLGFAGMPQSVGVKFDLYDNLGEGNNSTGLYFGGEAPMEVNSITLDTTGVDLQAGNVLRVAMVYNGATLQVTITDTVTQASILHAYNVDIPALVGDTAFVGFTAATGGLSAQQEILRWTYNTSPTTPGQADLQVTVSDGVLSAVPGTPLTYTIQVSNQGPAAVTGASVADVFPASLTGVTFISAASAGSSGNTANGSGNIADTVNLPPGGTITYTVQATISASATGTITNTATVTAPLSVNDPTTTNNSATDTTTVATGTVPILDFPDGFAGAAAQFAFNGPAAAIVGGNLQLTSGAQAQTSSVYALTPVNVAEFSTQFDLQIAPGSTPMADGLTFVIQGAGLTAIGDGGGSLGYAGMANSVAVKFDLYDNAGEGTNSTGLVTAGAGPLGAGAINLNGTGISLHSGNVLRVTMTYSGAALAVNITDTITQASASQNYTVNIPALVGGNTAFVGFTGATGGFTAVQNILRWTYSTQSTIPQADLRITKTDSQTNVAPGSPLSYTIVVTNLGPAAVTGATVVDSVPATLENPTYTSVAIGGASGNTSGAGTIADSVNLPVGGTITYTLQGTLASSASGSISNTALVAIPAGVNDPVGSNNSATDVNTIGAGSAPVINFPTGFTGADAQFSLNGASAGIVGGRLRLTSGGAAQTSSIYSATSVSVAAFATQFDFQITPGSTPMADGLTFVIHGGAATAIGGGGGGLGYAGMAQSVAVTFDLYDNAGEGINSTGLVTAGGAPQGAGGVNLTGTGINLHNGNVLRVQMTYDGTTLQVVLTDTVTQLTATQNYTVDIPALIGSATARVGFTGSTGGFTAVQNILNWTYSASAGQGGGLDGGGGETVTPQAASVSAASSDIGAQSTTVSAYDPITVPICPCEYKARMAFLAQLATDNLAGLSGLDEELLETLAWAQRQALAAKIASY